MVEKGPAHFVLVDAGDVWAHGPAGGIGETMGTGVEPKSPGLDQSSETCDPPMCEPVGLSTEPALLGLGGEFPDPVWAHHEPSSLSGSDG